MESEIRARAKRRVYARLGLYWHAFVYVMAGAAMIAIHRAYTPESSWIVWPLAAWGAALALHAFATLSSGHRTETMIEAEIRRERERRDLT